MGCSSLVSFVGYLRGDVQILRYLCVGPKYTRGKGVIKPRESFSISSSVEVLNANAS